MLFEPMKGEFISQHLSPLPLTQKAKTRTTKVQKYDILKMKADFQRVHYNNYILQADNNNNFKKSK